MNLGNRKKRKLLQEDAGVFLLPAYRREGLRDVLTVAGIHTILEIFFYHIMCQCDSALSQAAIKRGGVKKELLSQKYIVQKEIYEAR